MEPTRIPLFPLEVVLFPGTLLPLHIFEPRYKLMIRHCRESQINFGVVLSQSEGLAAIGCTAEIMEVAKEYPDGKLDILTVGRLAYRVTEVFQERAYLEAAVEYLEDEPYGEQAPSPALLDLFERCHGLVYSQPPGALHMENYESLAYHIASELPLDLGYKQRLLEMRNEGERRSSLESALQEWMTELEEVNRARRIAGGNGHRQVS